MNIDRQRIAAVKTLEARGWKFDGQQWTAPSAGAVPPAVTDQMHRLLVECADTLAGSIDGSCDAETLVAIANAIDAYEQHRWPTGMDCEAVRRRG